VVIPKALSCETLDVNNLPANRPYLLHPVEKYPLQSQYFEKQEAEIQDPERLKNEYERDLRTTYRMGHIDEIRRLQFGKKYIQVKQLYMQMELEAIRKPKTRRFRNN
jgi:hypothetical protein